MTKTTAFILIISLVVLFNIVEVKASPLEKVTICHHTGSETNPWIRIVVSGNAMGGHFHNSGIPKVGHSQDLLLEGEMDCPETPSNGGGGGGVCPLPEPITMFDVFNHTPNDNQLELGWLAWNVELSPEVNIRWGWEDGNWLWFLNGSSNDGSEEITGLTNGVHYWFSIQASNDCGVSEWSDSVDPLP